MGSHDYRAATRFSITLVMLARGDPGKQLFASPSLAAAPLFASPSLAAAPLFASRVRHVHALPAAAAQVMASQR